MWEVYVLWQMHPELKSEKKHEHKSVLPDAKTGFRETENKSTGCDKNRSRVKTSVDEADFVEERDALEDLVDAPGQVAFVVSVGLEVRQKWNNWLCGQENSLFALDCNAEKNRFKMSCYEFWHIWPHG